MGQNVSFMTLQLMKWVPITLLPKGVNRLFFQQIVGSNW